jgi:uncharacterized cupin superfamily protein
MFWRLIAVSLLSASTMSSFIKHTPKVSAEVLQKFRVSQWSKWSCAVSTFPWSYQDAETCYIIKGKVTVTPKDNAKYGPAVSLESGDMCTFPEGMECTWKVSEPLEKHYTF